MYIAFLYELVPFLPVAVILIAFAWYKKSFKPIIAGSIALVAYLFDLGLRILPDLLSSNHGEWNWLGTSLSFLWPWSIVYGLKWLTPQEMGLEMKWRNLLLGLTFGLLLGSWNVLDGIYLTELPSIPSLNSIFFQLFMPSLSEELLYRGLISAIFTHFLGTPYKLLSITLVSLLFINVHLFNQTGWIGTPDLIVNITLFTIVAAYLKLKTNSIWPGVICHGLMNSMPFITAYFFPELNH